MQNRTDGPRKPLHIVVCKNRDHARDLCQKTAEALRLVCPTLVRDVGLRVLELTCMRVCYVSAKVRPESMNGVSPHAVTYTCEAPAELVEHLYVARRAQEPLQ